MIPDWLTSSWFWSSLLSTLLLPPAGLLLAGFVGMFLVSKRPTLGWLLVVLSVLALWVLSTPYVGYLLLSSTGETKPFDGSTVKFFEPDQRPEVIVVLGAGRVPGALEYEGEGMRDRTLARVRYAARLHRETGLPVMTVGGKPDGGSISEATLMKSALEYEFGVPVRLVENESATTLDGARLCAPLLRDAGYHRILLVTDYWHMRRAKASFKQVGLGVVAAPMGYRGVRPTDPSEWLPTAEGLTMSRIALRELVGSVVMQVRMMVFPIAAAPEPAPAPVPAQ